MTRWLALLLACLALGLVAAGCGDDDDDDDGGSAQTTEQTDTAATEETTEAETDGGQPAGETVEVSMKDIKFDPAEVSVPVGGTIMWTNDESVPHDVTKESGPGEDFSSGSGNMQQGDTFEQTFSEAGTVEYVCTVHPGMAGTVTVE